MAFLLQPFCRLMFERVKRSGYLQIDQTPVKVLDPEDKGKCARGYLWFYAVPGGGVFLNSQGARSRAAPHSQLTGFTGTIQTDAYEVCGSLKKAIPDLIRIGCAAHSHRKFHRAFLATETVQWEGAFPVTGNATISNATILAALDSGVDFIVGAWNQRAGLNSINCDEITVRRT